MLIKYIYMENYLSMLFEVKLKINLFDKSLKKV